MEELDKNFIRHLTNQVREIIIISFIFNNIIIYTRDYLQKNLYRIF